MFNKVLHSFFGIVAISCLFLVVVSCEIEEGLPDENGVPPFGQFIATLNESAYTPFLSTSGVELEPDTTTTLTYSVRLIPNSLLIESYFIIFSNLEGSSERLGEYTLNPERLTSNRGGIIFYRAPDSTIYVSTSGKFTLFKADTTSRNIIQATFEGILTASDLEDEDVQPDQDDISQNSEPEPNQIHLTNKYRRKLITAFTKSLQVKKTSSLQTVPSLETIEVKNGGFHLEFFLSESEYEYNEDKLPDGQ